MNSYPRYFVFGNFYFPPDGYVRLDGPRDARLVNLDGSETAAPAFKLDRCRQMAISGLMIERSELQINETLLVWKNLVCERAA
jgi:hypothetical protein